MKTFFNGLYYYNANNPSIMKYSVIITCVVIITSCAKDYQVGNVGISEISIPDSVKANELVKITIKAEATNGCWSNLGIEFTEKNVFEYLIQASGKFSGCKNCDCPDLMIYEDFEIDFQPKIKGKYFFHIKNSRDKIDIDSMTVD